MNYIAQRDVLKQLGISISTLKRWQKHRGFPDHLSVSESVKIYLKTYPLDKNVIYAHYLIAIIHFEQITDEKKDLKPILNASEKINFFFRKISQYRLQY